MCLNNSSCGCHLNRCRNLGPFTAVDRDCMIPPAILRAGYMIPYASNTLFTLFDSAVTPTNNFVQIAFGSNTAATGPAPSGGTITLAGAGPNEAFQVSQAGNITAFSASFTNNLQITVDAGESAIVTAQIWKAPVGLNVFSPTSATINLIQATGPVNVLPNTVSTNSQNIFPPVPVAVGERLLLVYSATVVGTVSVIAGTASASITIS